MCGRTIERWSSSGTLAFASRDAGYGRIKGAEYLKVGSKGFQVL